MKNISRDDLIYKATKIINKASTPVEISFYESPEWRKAREEYLKTNPLCEPCLNDGIKNKSDHVHHINLLSQGGEPFSEDNLIALCASCHSSIHASGGICVELDLMNPSSSFDGLNNFTTQLEKINESLISQCKEGEALNLIRERKPNNINYVGVANKSGEYLGDINPRDINHYYLAFDIDHGSEVSAIIKEIFTKRNKLQCVIEITKSEPDWEEVERISLKGKKASEFGREAKQLEKTDYEQAIQLYRKATEILIEIDRECEIYPTTWRILRFPIYRISLILERQKRYKECLEEIEAYEKLTDKIGLYAGEKERLEKRKEKVLKAINKDPANLGAGG